MKACFHIFPIFALIAPLAAQVETAKAPEAPQAPAVTAIELDQRTPEATLQSIVTNLKAGKAHALLSAVTPEDRAEIQNMLQGVVGKIDPGLYDQVMGIVTKLGTVLKHNAKFIANNEDMNGGQEPEDFMKSIEAASTTLTSISKGQLGSHAKASKMQLMEVVASTGGEVWKLTKMPGANADLDLESIEIGEAKVEEDTAWVTVTSNGEPHDLKMKSVQGKWFFDIANTLASAKEDADSMPKMTKQDAMQAGAMLQQFVLPLLSKFEDVESQEEFDDEVENVKGMLMGLMGGFGGGFAPPPGGGFGK